MKTVLVSTLIVCLTLLLWFSPVSALDIGTTAPDFRLPNLSGEKVGLSDFKGQIIVLKLATTWCPTCKQQVEEILDIGDFLREQKVVFVEVFLQDSEAMIKDHLKGITYPMPHSALIDNGQVARAYSVYVIPRLLVVGPDFKIRRDGSMITGYDLKKKILEVAAGK